MRMRALYCGMAVAALAGSLSACTDYYEGRIGRLTAECDIPDLTPEEVASCKERATRLQATYPSPRLDELLAKLEYRSDRRQAGPMPRQEDEVVGPSQEQDVAGYDDELVAGPDYGEMGLGEGSSEGYWDDDDALSPGPDRMPPSEPQEPTDPDE